MLLVTVLRLTKEPGDSTHVTTPISTDYILKDLFLLMPMKSSGGTLEDGNIH